MKKTISIGIQGFSDLRERNCYFVDKTHFIKENYDVEHTLDFDTILDDLEILCKKNGGTL